MEKYIGDLGLTLLGGLFLAGFGAYGMEEFLKCDYMNYSDSSQWANPAGFNVNDFCWFVVGVFCMPISLVCFSVVILHTFKGLYPTSVKLFVLYGLLVGSIWCCHIGNLRAEDTLDCGVFCTGTLESVKDTDYSSGEIFTGLVYFFVCMILAVIISIAILLLHVEQFSGNHAENKYGFKTAEISIDNTISPLTASLMSGKHHDNADLPNIIEPLTNPAIPIYNNRKKHFALFLVFIVLYPVLVIACMSLPTWWAYFGVGIIRTYQHALPPQQYNFYWSWKIGDDLQLKLFPDILLFYGGLYLVILNAFIAEYVTSYKRMLHRRFVVPIINVTCSVGEALISFVLFGMMLGQFLLYFFGHGWQNTNIFSYTTQQRAARALGQCANVIVGLLMLPISRNNVWSIVFGIGYESMIRFHQYLGGLFVATVLMHMFTWWSVYKQEGSFPRDIFAVPQTFHADNFTVPMIVLVTLCMMLIMVPTALPYIRRQNYDLFYISHHFFMILFFAMLWHATMAWYYVIGGLTLWMVDHIIRMCNCINTSVKVVNFTTGGSKHITQLSYQVYSPYSDIWNYMMANFAGRSNLRSVANDVNVVGRIPQRAEDGMFSNSGANAASFITSSFHPMHHEVGQYCFINIPSIALNEWHPFTISSSPCYDKYTTHHIRNMKDSEWTGKLYALAQEYDHGGGSIAKTESEIDDNLRRSFNVDQNENMRFMKTDGSDIASESEVRRMVEEHKYDDLLVNIDGPYGCPFQVSRFSHIVLVAGGIGVTPMHAYFRYIYFSLKSNAPGFNRIRKVRLLWSVRDVSDIKLFQHTVSSTSCN